MCPVEYSVARKARPDRTAQRLRHLARTTGLTRTDVDVRELGWSDFDHVARDRDHIERVIRGALRSGAAGVNMLLYGPPGTGKTEFCKVLAERLDASLYSAGESDDKGDEPVRGERLQELRLAQRLLAGHGGSLLLFDEMEDLLSNPFPAWGLFGPHARLAFRNTGSKVYMHRLLEGTPTPTLWTMNSTRGVSEMLTWMESHPLPLRLHHELRRAPRPRHLAAVRLQGAARLPHAGAE